MITLALNFYTLAFKGQCQSEILHVLERVQQSNDQLKLDDGQLRVRFVRVSPPQGLGQHKRQCTQLDKLRRLKRSIVRIKNKDNLCLARAIVVARARLEHLVKPDDKCIKSTYNHLREGDKPPRRQQFKAAKKLMKDAGLEKHKGSCGIPEIHAIQTIMPDYQIRVFSSMTPGSLTYTSPEADHVVDLYNHDNHFDIITSLPAFFDNSSYCPTCNVPYSNKDRHQCLGTCPCCHESPACPNVLFKDTIKCAVCNRYFRGTTCLANHLKHTERRTKDKVITFPSICDRLQCCKDCGKHIRGVKAIKEHKCHHFMCRTCQKVVPQKDHKCYMQLLDPKKEVVLKNEQGQCGRRRRRR